MGEPRNHVDDCYFCSVSINGINFKNRTKWKYSTTTCIQGFSVPKNISGPLEHDNTIDKQNDNYFKCISKERKCFSQNKLDDLDLYLSEQASVHLVSRLNEKTFPSPSTPSQYFWWPSNKTTNERLRNSKTDFELRGWTTFISVMQNFLGNVKSENYIEFVEDLLLQLKK